MQPFKFNAGSRSVERAVADAIGQGIAARREADASMPHHWTQLLAKLDNIHDARHPHNDTRLAPRRESGR